MMSGNKNFDSFDDFINQKNNDFTLWEKLSSLHDGELTDEAEIVNRASDELEILGFLKASSQSFDGLIRVNPPANLYSAILSKTTQKPTFLSHFTNAFYRYKMVSGSLTLAAILGLLIVPQMIKNPTSQITLSNLIPAPAVNMQNLFNNNPTENIDINTTEVVDNGTRVLASRTRTSRNYNRNSTGTVSYKMDTSTRSSFALNYSESMSHPIAATPVADSTPMYKPLPRDFAGLDVEDNSRVTPAPTTVTAEKPDNTNDTASASEKTDDSYKIDVSAKIKGNGANTTSSDDGSIELPVIRVKF